LNRLATRKELAAPRVRNAGVVSAREAAPARTKFSIASAAMLAPTKVVVAPRNSPPGSESLEQCVLRNLEQYFADLGGAKPHALHEMVLGAVERPLLQFALRRCDGNQSAAADLLGINRNTLRRKLQDYGLH
jgi:Fis family transcriptional regulator, factor for inversion stimulation protein